jgi:hypothetical protein
MTSTVLLAQSLKQLFSALVRSLLLLLVREPVVWPFPLAAAPREPLARALLSVAAGLMLCSTPVVLH